MSTSCFKIISCGNHRDAIGNDDLQSSPQSKGASDKRGWSFRKRSARHRVLSNTVISETPSPGNKGSPESAAVDFQKQPNSTIPDKTSAVQSMKEKPQLLMPVNLKLSETTAAEAGGTKVDASADESVVVIIQTGIRGFLAQKVLLKHKYIIKLQAAVRGHFVRRQAAGTLRCVQAIVKMQALVRARRARVLEDKSSALEKHENSYISTATRKEKLGSQPYVKYTSIEKLLSNKFAQQLLESTARTKSINIKCDPLKSDSAWKWLERWMLVSSAKDEPSVDTKQLEQSKVENVESQEENLVLSESNCKLADLKPTTEISVDTKQQEQKKIEYVDSQEETLVLSERNCKSADIRPTIETSESEDNLIIYDADKLDVQAYRPTSPSGSHNLDHSVPHDMNEINSKVITSDSLHTLDNQSDLPGKLEPNIIPARTDTDGVQSLKRAAPEQPETEGKKLCGSRKASNPAFLSAQSKFEELSTAAYSRKSVSSTYQDAEVESYTDTSSSLTDHALKKMESDRAENFVSDSSKLQYVDFDTSKLPFSECGTEISISSTLDSPDMSEIGANELEQEVQSIKDSNGHPEHKGNVEVEVKGDSSKLDSDLPQANVVQPEAQTSLTGVNDDGIDSVMSIDLPQVEKKPNIDVCGLQMEEESEKGHQECKSSRVTSPSIPVIVPETNGAPPSTDVPELQVEAETEKDHQVCKSSPEASPGIHLTTLEPQRTPSSDVSVKPKRMRDDKSGSNHKLKSSSAGKRISSNLNHDSGARSSIEQLPKDHRNAKRRNSVGSPKPDQVDQEPRESISSNSLPSYMQTTESARAKALLNSSPRSSPDVQDKEVYVKKRHSLPGANGRHGSPQIQRTNSEAQRAAKANGTPSPKERKWQR